MRTALDDLQIVDVERKPGGMKDLRLSPDVPREQLLTQLQSLAQRGFFPVGNRDGSIDLLSSEGEAVVDLKDGTQYILRFGQIAAGDDESKETTATKESGSRLNRYLFVMAQFDPDLIPKPTLEPLPGDDAEKPADDGAKPDADDKKDEKEKPAAEAKADDSTKSIDQQAKEEDEAEKKKAETEKRAAIERENKRKQDEYEEKLKKGEEHVKQLNERFADWYYVISDDVYHKIHLAKGDVIKTKDVKPGEGNTPADLHELEKKGLTKGLK
jgi:hypothetical protein